MPIKDARSLPAQAQEDLRRKAILAVRRGTLSQTTVAELLGVSRRAVSKWVSLTRVHGLQGLRAKRRGRPRGDRLLPWQAAQIVRTITDRHPEQLKLPFYLWTREAVGMLIEQRFGLRLSVWTVGRYLARWGFTPQKPVRRALEQDPAAVQRWVAQEYPAIRTQAKQHKAEIYWGDEMGLRSDHAVGRTYGRRGHTPVIPGTGQRFGCNMLSAITNRGRLYFMVFHKRFGASVFLDFLRRLVRQVPRRIFLIVDQHPVHKARKVTKWLADHANHIRLFYLPKYSPELNPDELLNQDVKSNAVGRRRAHHQHQMLQHIRGYLRSRQRRPALVKRYFHEPHVRYAAA